MSNKPSNRHRAPKARSLLALTLAATALAHPRESAASPSDASTVWSWGNLRVESYRVAMDGSLRLRFTNANGAVFTNWADQSGTNQCPGEGYLRVHKDHPLLEELGKALMTAGLSEKPVHIWFEGVDGICYVKSVSVTM
jgi:hypothetical protein